MLPSDVNLNNKARTAGNKNKILVSGSGFSLRRNDMSNTSAPEKTGHKAPIVQKHASMPKAAHKEVLPSPRHTSAITNEEEKIDLVLALTSAFGIWYTFR